MIRQYEHFNNNKATVSLLYADASMHLAVCRYRRPSEDEFFMPTAAITYVQEGRKVVFLNGEKYEMKEGDALFIPKNSILYSDISVKQTPFVSLNTLIRDERLLRDDTLQWALGMKNAPAIPGHDFPASDPGVLGWMACRITDNLHLRQYARSGNMSLSTFKRWFREHIGHSPTQWIIGKRLERARYLLLHKQLPVSEACYESGFRDVSYFIRKYRQRFGNTPGSDK